MRYVGYLLLVWFVVSGILVIILDASCTMVASGSSRVLDCRGTNVIKAVAQFLQPFQRAIFGLHMANWMIFGMLSNYFWDFFRYGGEIENIDFRELLLPLLVSPIIFFSVWSLWPVGEDMRFSLNLVAFQNGFFWQVILSKAGAVSTLDPVVPKSEKNKHDSH